MATISARPVTRSDGVGAECDSVCARLLECRAADGEGLRYRFRDRKIAARCPGVHATRSNARRFQIIANYSTRGGLDRYLTGWGLSRRRDVRRYRARLLLSRSNLLPRSARHAPCSRW